jgi:hypothetical protein
MAQAAVIIETPALVEVGVPILVTEYDAEREINAAGAWTVSFPATQTLAKQVRSRWRISIIEEGRSGYLLRRGIVTSRNYRVNADGTGVLSLAGYTRLYDLVARSTHQGLAFDGSETIEDIANELTGETVTVPASASSITPTVSYTDISKLAALLSADELARYNVRETFDEDGFELVEQDDVPDSGFRFVNVQQAGPEIEHAADNGMGLIAGTPTIGYDGANLATRIIPVGTDWDGKPLTLGSSNKSAPYTIHSALNPDGTSYYYLEDADAVAASGVIEFQYIRADVRNPSDDAGTKLAAANVLYALAAGELLKRRYDVVSFACEIANGRHIDALPGDRVRIQFRGFARTPYGVLTWQDIDQDFLIVKRRDASSAAGVRGVSFTLAAPEVPMTIPALPEAVPIPPPPKDVPDPPYPGDPGGGGGDPGGDPGDPEAGPDVPPFEAPGPLDPTLPDIPQLDPNGPQRYQPCCAPPTSISDGPKDPPDVSGLGDITASQWFDGDPIPAGSVIFLHVYVDWLGTGPEPSHSLTPTDMTAELLQDFTTVVEDESTPSTNYNSHDYFYAVRVTGPSPSIAASGAAFRGYICSPTGVTVDIVSSAAVTEPFAPGDTVTLSLPLGAGALGIFIVGADWGGNDAKGVGLGDITHTPTDDGWTESSPSSLPFAGKHAGAGTATFTVVIDSGNALFIGNSSLSIAGCVVEITP